MAELMRKFYEMNDMDVLIVAFLYFATVIGLWIYTCKQWKKQGQEKKGDRRGKKRNTMDRRGDKLLEKKH